MKGVIADCLMKLIQSKFSEEKWKTAKKKNGLPENITFLPTQDINDELLLIL